MAEFDLLKNRLAKRTVFTAIATIGAVLLISVSGCGKKDALYLPEPNQKSAQKTSKKSVDQTPKTVSDESSKTRQTTEQKTP